jgi:hypothetical protein
LANRSLRSRIKQHIRDNHKGKWTHFSFYQTSEVKYTKDFETTLLRIFKPPGNKQSGTFPGHRLSKRMESEHLQNTCTRGIFHKLLRLKSLMVNLRKTFLRKRGNVKDAAQFFQILVKFSRYEAESYRMDICAAHSETRSSRCYEADRRFLQAP